jgi:sec-independent protein translocase protein TatA
MWKPGLPELLILLVIVLILFGPGRLAKLAGELGNGIRSFRDGLNSKQDENPDEPKPPAGDQK